ncbi:MAG: universal stress protein [Acidobacteria bacterium]|nr:universal stress protein [Acidobacteriota bacterium]
MLPHRAIIAAVDFSDTSRTALVLAARFARHCGAALHVLHAEDPLLSATARHAGIDLARETGEELQRFITSAWPAAECSPQRHVVTGAAVDVILDTAHRVEARMVVVGIRGMSGAERLVFGSTTGGLLRRADVSVLVAPAGWKPPRPDAVDLSGTGPIVAGVDLSGPSVAGAEAACTLASTLGTSVEIVHVVPNLAVLSRWRAHAEIAVRDRVAAARRELELAQRSLACSVPVETRVEVGAVPSRLAEAAGPARDRAPILVLGRKAPGSKGAPPGTTAYRVLTLANVPVLMYVSH